jgi:hypothetical protein
MLSFPWVQMRDKLRASALLASISAVMPACGTSQSGENGTSTGDAATDAVESSTVDASNGADAADASSGPDGATTVDGPAGFFIVGDIDGRTWLARYNIVPVENSFLFEVATVEPTPPSREWQLNFTLPDDPFPYTLGCVGNYIEFHEIGLDPERRFVSRTATSFCEVKFVEPASAGTLEGTFTANLTLRGTSIDYPVTNGRFRLPLAR